MSRWLLLGCRCTEAGERYCPYPHTAQRRIGQMLFRPHRDLIYIDIVSYVPGSYSPANLTQAHRRCIRETDNPSNPELPVVRGDADD
jgi:hypothetical protein